MNLIFNQTRRIFKGVSWRDPFVSFILKSLNPLDYAVRLPKKLSHLPKYSVRVRSNGIMRQFGGQKFSQEGRYLSKLLQEQANISAQSTVLEIGCGCGRIPLALATDLKGIQYTGADIDPPSLNACKQNKLLTASGFQFDLIDVYNELYNPTASTQPDNYSFPYADSQFDLVFLFSVFTHILPSTITNYSKEISRMLKPGGVCLFSAFILDFGTKGKTVSFPHNYGHYAVYLADIPEKAVGYKLDFLDKAFAQQNMARSHAPLFGPWRLDSANVESTIEYAQDVLIYRK